METCFLILLWLMTYWVCAGKNKQEDYKKESAVVPHGMHGLAPWFSVADSHILPLVHGVEKLDIYSAVHGLSISKVTQILHHRKHDRKARKRINKLVHVLASVHIHLYLATKPEIAWIDWKNRPVGYV